MNNEQILKNISDTIVNFLKEQNGLSNGYNTYVEGTVKKYIGHALSWSTPQKEKLTFIDYKDIGRKLNESIINILIAYNSNIIVYIHKEHIENGCFKTLIEIRMEPIRINIFNI